MTLPVVPDNPPIDPSGEPEYEYEVTIRFYGTYSFIREWLDSHIPSGTGITLRSKETIISGEGL